MDNKPNILSRALAKLNLMQKELVEESQVLDELKIQEEADARELKTLQSELDAKVTLTASLNEELKKREQERAKLEAGLKSGAAEFNKLLDDYEALKEDSSARRLKLEELNAANQRLLRVLGEKEENHKSELDEAKAKTAGKEALAASLREELKKQEEENRGLSRELLARTADFKAALDKERAEFRLNCEKLDCGSAEAEKGFLREIETLKEDLRHRTTEMIHAGAELKVLLDTNEGLRKDLREREEEASRLSQELPARTTDLKTALDKERAEFRLNYEKLQHGFAEAEKGLLNEAEALRESLRLKTAEAARAGVELQTRQDRNETLSADYDVRLAKLDILNSSLKEEVKKQKIENEALSREMRGKTAETLALLESERTEARTAQTGAYNEIRALEEAAKRLRHEKDNLNGELEKAGLETAELMAQREAGLVKIKELEMFSKSAASALKEHREEIELLKDREKDLTEELVKHGADSKRRLELLRLELDEKNRQLARHTRELEAVRSEKETLRSELADRAKEKK